MTTYVALLRAINVGGRNRVPMEALRALFVRAGALDVRTYIQSGNVVFRCDDGAAVCAAVSAALWADLGVRAPIVVRTAAELREVVARTPFDPAATLTLHVYFLADRPDAARVAALDRHRSPGDSFVVVGSEVYVAFGVGAGASKLTVDWFDGCLGTTATARNWRTVCALVALSGGE